MWDLECGTRLFGQNLLNLHNISFKKQFMLEFFELQYCYIVKKKKGHSLHLCNQIKSKYSIINITRCLKL